MCVFLDGRDAVVRGQVAHVNRDSSDARLENLAWLCFNHHDEYDSRTSQSKGLTEGELRHWRDQLVRKYSGPLATWPVENRDEAPRDREEPQGTTRDRPWRYPLWQVDDQLDLFAFTSSGADGVCLIERIDLPDGRVVIACLQAAGNPGSSITNSVEDIAWQVCQRFEIDPARLVWLEHYPYEASQEWQRVEFEKRTASEFEEPRWTLMSDKLWRELGLEPLEYLNLDGFTVLSKLRKLFRPS